MTKEKFEQAIKEVYDNLDKPQFIYLLDNTSETIRNLIRLEEITQSNTDELIWEYKNNITEVACKVFFTVNDSKRISFKQFKMLSAFSKTDWLNINKEEEYKQF